MPPKLETARWKRVEDLFHQALDLPPAQRRAYLEERCDGDAEVLRRAEELLAASGSGEGRITDVVAVAVERSSETVAGDGEAPPSQVGPYRIRRQIGRGGLGTVYLAERADGQFHKSVALKIVRRGLDTADVLGRFQQEREILARLEHPNITRILDAGSTDDGRPFFAMELVEGEPIDRYCAERRLTLRQRLELFRVVCSAVSHAHQNLIIHRDLKPSNLLVTEEGQPKLLDFGIAKLLDPEGEPEAPVRTHTGLLVLTPEYASPEQTRGEMLTTRTDVYSLAVILYRLLTGTSPYGARRLGFAEHKRLVCEEEPAPPSQAVTPEGLDGAGIRQDPRRLCRWLKGDLDTIVLMALRKEPRRRYHSVEQLAEDLRRYQAGEPILAQRDRLSYRARKFAGRHRWKFVTLALGILLFGAVIAFYTLELRHQRDVAQQEARKAEQVSSLLVGLLEPSDPSRARGETVTVRELLDRAAEDLGRELEGQPEVRASLMELMGSIYANLGLFEEAEPLLVGALEDRRRRFPAPDPRIATSMEKLGELRYARGQYGAAEELLESALDQRRKALGGEHPKVGKSLNDLAAVLHTRGRFREAEALYREALGVQIASVGPADRETLMTQGNLAGLLYQMGDLAAAEELGREVLPLQREVLGPDHPDAVATENTLAAILIAGKRFREAEPRLRRVVELRRRIFGKSHPKVALSLNNLGASLYHQGRFDEAEECYRRALEDQLRVLGEKHRSVVATLLNLADLAAWGRGDDEGAAELYRRALRLDRELLPAGHADLVSTLVSLGRVELRRGRVEAAEELLREASEIHYSGGASAAPPAAELVLAHAQALEGLGRREAAMAALNQALEVSRDAGRGEAPEALALRQRLATLGGGSVDDGQVAGGIVAPGDAAELQ